MNGIVSQIWTYPLVSSTVTITESFGLVILSILVTSGTCVITGSRGAGSLPPTAITLSQGQGMTITSEGELLSGTIITSSGTTVLSGR
jgi:hypothetical protein